MANVHQHAEWNTISSSFGRRWPRSSATRHAALGIFQTLVTWQQRSTERQHLANMSDFYLKDIGISRADAETEAAKPFWQA